MIIYVCSKLRGMKPYSAEQYERNLHLAAVYCAEVASEGHVPIAPHLYFSEFLDDEVPEDREAGIRMGQEVLKICDEVWVFGAESGIGDGMAAEIKLAESLGKPVKYREDKFSDCLK